MRGYESFVKRVLLLFVDDDDERTTTDLGSIELILLFVCHYYMSVHIFGILCFFFFFVCLFVCFLKSG